MDYLIVCAGLLAVAAGVALSWYKKPASSIWVTYAFGFLLVLIGGPLRANLSGLSVSAKGVEASFKPPDKSTTDKQVKENERKARETISILSREQQKQVTGQERQVIDEASESVVAQLLPFIASLGFVPTQIIGSQKLEPGTILSFTDGRAVTVASSSEGFPRLNIQSSNVAIPRFAVQRDIPGSQAKRVAVQFDCTKGSQILEASTSSLTTTLDPAIFSRLSKSQNYFVVQSVLKCLEPRLESATDSRNPSESSKNSFEYSGPESVLGYKLLAIGVEK